jgi:hypothetical protein
MNVKCYACDKAFSLKTSLVIHVNRIHKQLKNYSCEWCSFTTYYKRELESHVIRKHAHQNDDSSDDLVKTNILIKEEKEEDQMPETYSDHKNFEEILVDTTKIDIKEECVADPLAINIDNKEAKVKQER